MEQLHEALERFKQQAGGSTSSRPIGGDDARSNPPPIVYSRTRVVECQDELLRRHRVLTGIERGAFVEGVKLLRAQVGHRLRENNWTVLGITSAKEGDGTSVIAANLAVSLAMEATQTVLLVDANLRAPRIHTLFGLGPCNGLTEYLLEEMPLEDILIHPGIGRLVVLPGGRAVSRSTEALTSPRMTALVDEIKHRYPARVIMFDLPPLLASADVLAFAPALDALLLVASEGKTKRREVEDAIQLIGRATPILGTVLNRAGQNELNLRAVRQLVSI